MVRAANEGPRLSDEEMQTFLALTRGSDSVELKLTVPEMDQRSAILSLGIDPLDAEIRQVFFFDTPGLALYQAGLVARARRSQGKGGDSVVKLRPVVPDNLPKGLRKTGNLVVEVDAMPGGFVCSASLKGVTSLAAPREVAAGARPIRRLFSKEQRQFFQSHAPEGVTLDTLSVLGPITVFKLKFSPKGHARKLVAELWMYPDNSRILELSTKCAPQEALDVASVTREYLISRGVDLSGEQQTKTKMALEYFVKLGTSQSP